MALCSVTFPGAGGDATHQLCLVTVSLSPCVLDQESVFEVFHPSILLDCALALSQGGLEAHKFGAFQRELSGKLQPHMSCPPAGSGHLVHGCRVQTCVR